MPYGQDVVHLFYEAEIKYWAGAVGHAVTHL